jgi:hypothetical protein
MLHISLDDQRALGSALQAWQTASSASKLEG